VEQEGKKDVVDNTIPQEKLNGVFRKLMAY
jgi:hypothetical protein